MSHQLQVRRSFLKQTASGSAIAPYHFTASRVAAQSKSERWQSALIGAGGSGTRTAPVAQQFVGMVGNFDVDATHLRDANKH